MSSIQVMVRNQCIESTVFSLFGLYPYLSCLLFVLFAIFFIGGHFHEIYLSRHRALPFLVFGYIIRTI